MSLQGVFTIWSYGIGAGLGFYFLLSILGYGIRKALSLLNA